MRYFLISLILNIAILFIPIKSDEISSKKQEETIQIKLVMNSYEEKEQAIEKITPQVEPESPEPEIIESKPVVEEDRTDPVEPKIIEPQVQQEVKDIQKPKEVKKPKIKKKKKTASKPIVEKNTQEIKQKNQAIANEPKENSINKEGYCKENIGFKIIKIPPMEYPRKALMLRLKDSFYVEVDFKIINDEIKIIDVRGANKIFNDEAVKLTKDMQIKVLKDIAHCVITKPYEFKIKD